MHLSTEKLLAALNEVSDVLYSVFSPIPREGFSTSEYAKKQADLKTFAKFFHVKSKENTSQPSVPIYILELNLDYLKKDRLIEIDTPEDCEKIKNAFYKTISLFASGVTTGMDAIVLSKGCVDTTSFIGHAPEGDGLEIYLAAKGKILDANLAEAAKLQTRQLA